MKKEKKNDDAFFARCWARASCRRPGLVLLSCLLSIGFASRAVYERRSTIVVDVKLTAYRARLTAYADRDETFVAARKHLFEEQGKRKYFYGKFPLVFAASEGDRGDPARKEERVRRVRSMMDLMLVERGARYGAIPNSVDWNELIVNAMLDFNEEEERITNAYEREENVIKLCELKRAIESSFGYEEACATRDQILGSYHAEAAGFGGPFFSKMCAPPWSVFDVNLVYMNVDIWHTAFQTLKRLYVYNDNDDDDDDENNNNNNIETTTRLLQKAAHICGENDTTSIVKANRLCDNDGFACEERGCEERVYGNDNGSDEMISGEQPKACNLIGTLSVCEWIERTKPTTEEIKIISEMPSLEEEIENASAPCDSVTILDQVRRSLRGLKVFSSWAKKWEPFNVLMRPWEPILDFDAFGFPSEDGVTTRHNTTTSTFKTKFGATRLIFQRKKRDLYSGISEEDAIRWVKTSFERTIREWGREYNIESALRFEKDKSDRVSWRHWQTYSSLELEQLAKDCRWIIAAFGACFALVFFHTGSIIVTVVSCVVVASSIVLAIFTYILGLDKVWVGVLHFLGVFCILGIGADDAFVLVDHWKLSAKLVPVPKKTHRDDDEEDDIETSSRCRRRNTSFSMDAEAWLIDRMSWTIQKSFFSICCTSATTTTAFATLIFSNIEPLRLFGIFAALSVAFCFFVTIAMVPASLIVDARLSERRRRFFAIVNAPGGRSSKVVPRRVKVVTAMEGGTGGSGESGEREAVEGIFEENEKKRLERIQCDATFPRNSRRSKSYGNETDLFAFSFERSADDNDDDDNDEKVKNMTTKMNTKSNLMDGYFDDDDDDDDDNDDNNNMKRLKMSSNHHTKNQKHKRAKSFGFLGEGYETSMRTVNKTNASRDRQRLDRLKRVLEPINDAFTRVDTARRAALGLAASISESIGKFAISKRYPVLILSFVLAAYEAYVASTLKPPNGSSHSIWPESYNPNVFARQNRKYIPYAKREEAIQIQFIFGIDPTKTRQSSGFDKTLRFEDTKVVFEEDFDDADVDAQKWMLNFCETLNNDPRILKPSLKCFTKEFDEWSQNFRYPNRVPFANKTQYKRYVEDFINDATFRAGEKGGLHIPHVISTDACALKNKNAYGFADKTIVQNALESMRIELREICEFLSDEENLALVRDTNRYYNNGSDLNATTTSVPSSWNEEKLRAFESASAFINENEIHSLNATNDGEFSASLFLPGADYYYGTTAIPPPAKDDEENLKHLALACSKLSEEDTCKRAIIISASINVSSTASQHDILEARDEWEQWFQQTLSTAPDIIRGSAFQTSSAWSYADTVDELSKGARTALVASFFFAFIVAFIASRSLVIAFATCFSVAFACAASLGLSATFRDWKFGVIESVCVTLLVGLSVDYPLHVASAYAAAYSSSKNDEDAIDNTDKERRTRDREEDAQTKESIENTPPTTTTTTTSPPPPSPSALSAKIKASNDRRRASRALRAIRSVGPSVIGGALTTASAAAFLFRGCVIVFFTTFGAFVIVALCMSVLSSAFVLTAALAVAGPA